MFSIDSVDGRTIECETVEQTKAQVDALQADGIGCIVFQGNNWIGDNRRDIFTGKWVCDVDWSEWE